MHTSNHVYDLLCFASLHKSVYMCLTKETTQHLIYHFLVSETPVAHMLQDDKHRKNVKIWSPDRREGTGTNKTK